MVWNEKEMGKGREEENIEVWPHAIIRMELE